MGTASKDKRDIYYRLAKENNYRARSAYKLIHLNEKYNLFNNDSTNIVDLCAAPGGWTQICVNKIYETNKEQINNVIVGVDLLKIQPFDSVSDQNNICKFIEGDITSIETIEKIKNLFVNKSADLVLCDGAPDVTGIQEFDEYYQNQLLLHALDIALKLYTGIDINESHKKKKTFVCKFFRGRSTFSIYTHLKCFFDFVELAKPVSSRNSSVESFFVCKGLKSHNQDPLIFKETYSASGNNVVPLEVCGSGVDPDLVTVNPNETLAHKFPPINPAYKSLIDKRKGNK